MNYGENLVNHEYGDILARFSEYLFSKIAQPQKKEKKRKEKKKGWQKGKFRTTKKEKKGKTKKKEKKTRLPKTSSKKEEKNKNRKLTAVYYCVAYSFALRSRQTQKERRAWRFIRRLLLLMLLLLRSLFSLSSWRTSGSCILETNRDDATRISVIALSRCCCFSGIDTHCHPVDEVRLPNSISHAWCCSCPSTKLGF
jgi:hypothetical protein